MLDMKPGVNEVDVPTMIAWVAPSAVNSLSEEVASLAEALKTSAMPLLAARAAACATTVLELAGATTTFELPVGKAAVSIEAARSERLPAVTVDVVLAEAGGELNWLIAMNIAAATKAAVTDATRRTLSALDSNNNVRPSVKILRISSEGTQNGRSRARGEGSRSLARRVAGCLNLLYPLGRTPPTTVLVVHLLGRNDPVNPKVRYVVIPLIRV